MTRCCLWLMSALLVGTSACAQAVGRDGLVERAAYDASADAPSPDDQGWMLRDDDGEADGLRTGRSGRDGWALSDDSASGSLLWQSGPVEGVGEAWTLSLDAAVREHTGGHTFCFQFGDGAQRWLVFLGETRGGALQAMVFDGGGRQTIELLARNDRRRHVFTITRAPGQVEGRLHFDGEHVGEPFEPIGAGGVDGVHWGTGSSGGKGAAVVYAVRLLAKAEPTIKLPWVLSRGMVIQRGRPAPVWGEAEPGASVAVAFAGQTKETTADTSGAWRVDLDAMRASGEGRAMTITAGDERRVLEDVLVGEVWVCAGQSNMWWPLGSSVGGDAAAARVAGSPTLRLLDPQPTVGLGRSVWALDDALALTPGRYFAVGGWAGGDAGAAGRFSAVGAYFGLYLQERLGVPVGLIDVAVGGTPAEAWVPRGAILANPETADLETNFLGSSHAQDFVRDRPLVHLQRWDEAGRPGDTPEHPFRPGFMYEAGIAPLAGLPVAGVLWYQGESNAEDAHMHDALFTAAVASWREAFGRDDLPVYWAQLPELNREMWPEFRESQQRLAESIPHSGMAVTIGLGHPTDVHPRDKGPVGERLARLALDDVYGEAVADSGPVPTTAAPQVGSISLGFDHADGLELRPHASGVTAFWVAGEDRRFARADAKIVSGELVLTSEAVSAPVAVRYAWEANTVATLYNGEGLPAAPFRTDGWDTVRVACVGDSITFGSTIGNPTSDSYPSQLSRLVGPLFDVRNFGVPGSSVVNGLIQQRSGWDRGYISQMAYRRSAVFEPDIVVINLGINDVTNERFSVDEFVEDYVALIEAYRALPSGPTVIIWHKLAPLFPGQAFYEHPRLALIQQALDRVVEQTGVETLDMFTPFDGQADRFPDKIHPDAQGAGVIADVTCDKLESMGVPVAHPADETD